MTRTPHDSLGKILLPVCLNPSLGFADPAHTTSSQDREIDVYFTPGTRTSVADSLGVLEHLAQQTTLFELSSKPANIEMIEEWLGKLIEVRNNQRREGRKTTGRRQGHASAQLWGIAPTASKVVLRAFTLTPDNILGPGIYRFPHGFPGGLVVVHQLPETDETLWLRIYGRGEVQRRAMERLEQLDSTHPLHSGSIAALARYRQQLESGRMTQATRKFLENSERLYKQWENATIAKGEAQGEARGEARGKVLGKAHALISILETRGIAISEEQRQTLLDCTDMQRLDTLLRASITVQSADELFAATAPNSAR